MASRRVGGSAHLWRNAITVACALLSYYCLPLDFDFHDIWPGRIVSTVAFLVGLVGLAWLIYRRLVRYLAATRETARRVDGLLLLLTLVVVFFSLFYYVLELREPEQFDGLSTRTDALYYTVATLGTVGFGDVHAVGQVARIAGIVQIVFDLVVIGTLLSVMTAGIGRRLDKVDTRRSDERSR